MSAESAESVDPRVAAALSRADDLASADVHEHVAIYEEVHETLQQVLAEAGEGPEAASDLAPADRRDSPENRNAQT
jgi:hypothetical protein